MKVSPKVAFKDQEGRLSGCGRGMKHTTYGIILGESSSFDSQQ